MDVKVGDILLMKKNHPCGSARFVVLRSGMDFKLKCEKCGHKYIPKYWPVFFAMHMGRTRHLRCPKCGEKSWQKKVL